MRPHFHLAYSVIALIVLLAAQGALSYSFPAFAAALMLGASIIGSGFTLYFATEAVEEVRSATHMFVILFAILLEFVLLFAFEYWFAAHLPSMGFPALPQDATGYLLESIMVFVFNPVYLPETAVGRALLIINTVSALGLVLFVLQNVSQIRRIGQHPTQDAH